MAITTNTLSTAQILDLLRFLGLAPATTIDPSVYTKTQLNNIYKDYMKYSVPAFDEMWTGSELQTRYANDPTMLAAFELAAKGYVPDEIENMLMGDIAGQAGNLDFVKNLDPAMRDALTSGTGILSPTQRQDLEDYYSFAKKKRESEAERLSELDRSAAEYGLSPASMEYLVPPEIVSMLRSPQGRNITAETKAKADAAQKKYEAQYNAMLKKIIAQGGESKADQERRSRPVVDVTGRKAGAETRTAEQQEMWDEYESGMFGPTVASRAAASTPAMPASRVTPQRTPEMAARMADGGVLARKAEVLNKLAGIEGQKDVDLAGALRNQLAAAYGSPFEMDLMAILAELARR